MTDAKTKTETRDVPADALRFEMNSTLQFAEQSDNPDRVPISMLARTPEPISHWYWGRVVHDMKGMFTRKPTAPIDYCHNGSWSVSDLIGFANKFKADPKEGLTIEGELVSTRGDDVARDVIDKGRAGIPFECSIDFRGSGIVIENVGEGASTKVNGYTFEGPGVVIRKWPLRSVAVCPYGADSGTKSAFAEKPNDGDDKIAVQFQFLETVMTDTNPATTPESEAGKQLTAEQIASNAAKEATEKLRGEIKRFTDQFGAENGVKWHGEGKTFEAALVEQNKLFVEQLKEKDGTIAELNEKIASLSTGETKPVDTDDSAGGGGSKTAFADLFSIAGKKKTD